MSLAPLPPTPMPAMLRRLFAPRTLRRATKGNATAVAAVAERVRNWRRVRERVFMMSLGILCAHFLRNQRPGQDSWEFRAFSCDNGQLTRYGRGHGASKGNSTLSIGGVDRAAGLWRQCGSVRACWFNGPCGYECGSIRIRQRPDFVLRACQ